MVSHLNAINFDSIAMVIVKLALWLMFELRLRLFFVCVWHLIDSTNCNNTPTTAVDNGTETKQDQKFLRGEHRKREREKERIDVSRTSLNFRDAKSAAIVQVHILHLMHIQVNHSHRKELWWILNKKCHALFATDDDAIQSFIITIKAFIKRWKRRMRKIEISKKNKDSI